MNKRSLLWLIGVVLLSGCMAVSSAATPEEATPGPASPSPTADTALETAPPVSDELLPDEPAPPGARAQFSTDFNRHTVPYSDVLSGGPPKDGIPAVEEPTFVSAAAADGWIEDLEPVVIMAAGDDVRAYPIQILMWHEIVNDVIGGVPVAVTFCPLCNTAIAFEGRIDGMDLDFGTTGCLRYSNLIMYDRQTETCWQQATGEGIAGQFAGRQLTFIPATMISWADFKAIYPEGKVLSRETGLSRPYGNNPYAGYDNIENSPFLYDGPETPGRLPPMARVLTLDLNGDTVAYPYAVLSELGAVNDRVGDQDIVVFWQPGVASALDRGTIADGRDVGTVVAFSRELDGELLSFRFDNDLIVDEQTGTVWNVLGQGAEGPLSGSQLEPIIGVNHFWFSWAAFRPETRVYEAAEPMRIPADSESPDSESAEADALSEDATGTSMEEVEPPAVVVDRLKVDFEIRVYQGDEILGGEQVLFSEILAQGKPVVVEFWAGQCPVCRRGLPEVQEVYRELGDEATFVALDVGVFTGLGDEVAARVLIADLGLTFPAGTIDDPSPMQTYRVTGIPTTLFFKPNGELLSRGGGLVGVEALKEEVSALIAASEL